jgi:DHA2 family methylenomycin A resistance protein-like MFS transporter
MAQIAEPQRPHPDTRQVTAGSARRRALVLVMVTVGYFLVLLDLTVVNVALPTIGGHLGASVSDQQWVIDAYTITLASLLLTGGKLGDLYGKKRVLIIGMVAFGLFSMACGLAATPGMLIGFRAVQGVGAAILLPTSLAIISATYRGDRAAHARAISIWAAVGSLAMPAGPLLGGLLVDLLSWRAVFLINLPIIAITVVGVWRLVEEMERPGKPSVDLPGIALGAAVLAAVTIAFIEGGGVGWGNPLIIAVAAAIPVLLALFVYVEHASRAPVLPLSMFRSAGTSIATAIAVFMSLVLLGTIFILTQYFQAVEKYSPLMAGVAMIPLFVPLAAFSSLSGRLTARKGAPFSVATGLVLGVAGMLLMFPVQPGQGYFASLFVPMLCTGVGMGLLTPAVVTMAMREAPREHTGIASGVNNTARQAGGAIGLAVFGSMAGSPELTPSFVHGFHLAVITGAAIWAAGVALAIMIRKFSAE